MAKTRLGTVIPIPILLLSIASCSLFNFGPKVASNPAVFKPAQVIDLPAMVGTSSEEIKSRKEITAMVGVPPTSDDSIGPEWEFTEGRLKIFYFSGKLSFISYSLRPVTVGSETFSAVNSPEDMAALVGIDLQGKKPDTDSSVGGWLGYYNLSHNGKMFNAAFDKQGKGIGGVRVSPEPR